MSSVTLTILIAFVVVALAIALLGVSWLITGNLRIRPGACGRLPSSKQDASCSSKASCSLCDKEKK